MSLARVLVMARVAGALAQRVGGRAQLLKAFQLIAYGATAGWLGGVFSVLPSLAMLGVLAALYSVYLIYRGVPVLMRVPQARAVGYTAALIACGVVAALVAGLVTSLVPPPSRSITPTSTPSAPTARSTRCLPVRMAI